jgi:hypothetical protein
MSDPGLDNYALMPPRSERLDGINDFNGGALRTTVDFSLPSGRMIHSLLQIIAWRAKPQVTSGTIQRSA